MPDILLGGIATNEVLVDPNGANNFDTDGNGTAQGGDEFLELINTSGAAIDISGLELWDAGQSNWFTFLSGPSPTVLEAGARAVVVRNVRFEGNLPSVSGYDLAFDAYFGTNVFNNCDNNLVVYDPTNDEYSQATYNGDAADDPPNDYAGFSPTAMQSGTGEGFGADQDGYSIQRNPIVFTNDATPTPDAANVCFTSGMLIETPNGFVQVEVLKLGDLVCTKDAGPQRLEWNYARHVTHLDATLEGFCYYHLLLAGHQILNASDIAAESLFLGKQGLNAVFPAVWQELATVFPDLTDIDSFVPPEPARLLTEGRRARRLGQRHDKNKRVAVCAF